MENIGTWLSVLNEGLANTVIATVGGIALTIVLSLVAGLALLSPHRWVRVISRIYVEGLRGTSEVVQLFWIFFALPVLVGFEFIPIWGGVAVLGLNHGAYGAEIVRGAVQSVPRAQYEGALALSLSPAQRMRRVILPQATVRMLPPIASTFITLVKDSALLSIIAVPELMRQSETLASLTFRRMEVLTVAAAVYFALTYPMSLGVNFLHRRLAVDA